MNIKWTNYWMYIHTLANNWWQQKSGLQIKFMYFQLLHENFFFITILKGTCANLIELLIFKHNFSKRFFKWPTVQRYPTMQVCMISSNHNFAFHLDRWLCAVIGYCSLDATLGYQIDRFIFWHYDLMLYEYTHKWFADVEKS